MRIGLMVPANNTTLEPELSAWIPTATVTTLRIPRGPGLLTPETLPAYQAGALKLAQTFRDAPVDVVAYGCTAAGFIGGPAGDRALTAELASIANAPVATVARSMVLELLALRVKSIALVTPYLDPVNVKLKAFLADAGIDVRRFDSLYAADVAALGRITADEVAAIARETMDASCDAMFIACAQLPTRSILDTLRTEFDRPVLSANSALTARVKKALEPASASA